MMTYADEVWVSTALLHRQQPQRAGFTLREIADRTEREGFRRPRPSA